MICVECFGVTRLHVLMNVVFRMDRAFFKVNAIVLAM